MKINVSEKMFIDSFTGDYESNFSLEGKKALYTHLIELEGDYCDVEIELDPIAFCCEYAEYEDLESMNRDYDTNEYETIEHLREFTTVIEFDGGIIINTEF